MAVYTIAFLIVGTGFLLETVKLKPSIGRFRRFGLVITLYGEVPLAILILFGQDFMWDFILIPMLLGILWGMTPKSTYEQYIKNKTLLGIKL